MNWVNVEVKQIKIGDLIGVNGTFMGLVIDIDLSEKQATIHFKVDSESNLASTFTIPYFWPGLQIYSGSGKPKITPNIFEGALSGLGINGKKFFDIPTFDQAIFGTEVSSDEEDEKKSATVWTNLIPKSHGSIEDHQCWQITAAYDINVGEIIFIPADPSDDFGLITGHVGQIIQIEKHPIPSDEHNGWQKIHFIDSTGKHRAWSCAMDYIVEILREKDVPLPKKSDKTFYDFLEI